MEQLLKNFLLAFIPVFVAVDAIGVLPVFVSLTEEFSRERKKKIIIQSMITAFCLAVGFIFLGKVIFRFLGITIGDFMTAGGAVLFIIAITDIMRSGGEGRGPANGMGAVPLGTPLIAGPAVLTTSLIMVEEYGIVPTLASVTSNILIVGIMFYSAAALRRFLGDAGSRALSKITSLFLAAIAVMMIRKGLVLILNPGS